MSTGIETWKNLSEIGPIYPFVGSEVMLVILGVLFWLIWHVIQMGSERRTNNEIKSNFKNLYRKE